MATEIFTKPPLSLPEYVQVSNQVREIEADLLSGRLTLKQLAARRCRARRAGKVLSCIDYAIAYELFTLGKDENIG